MVGWRRTALRSAALGVLAAMCFAPEVARATSTRAYTLGVMNRFIIDDSNKWLYPQAITNFGSLFYLELFGTGPTRATAAPGSERIQNTPGPTGLNAIVGTDLQTFDTVDSVPVQQSAGGGAIVKVIDDLYVGLHLSDYENPTVPAFLALLAANSTGDPNQFPWLAVAPPDAPGTANRKFDLFVAYNLQDLAKFGLKLSYGSSKYIRNPNDNDMPVVNDENGNTEPRKIDEIKTSELGIDVGGSMNIGEVAAIDVGLGLVFHSLTYLPNDRDLIDGGGGIELRADARALIGVSEQWEVVPAVSFRYSSLSAADLANYVTGLAYNGAAGREQYFITDVAQKRLVFDIGTAAHYVPTDFLDFWAAVGLQFGKWSAEFEHGIPEAPESGVERDQPLEFARDTISHDATPYVRFALEAKLLSWLDFRGGVIKFMRADTVKEDKLDDNVTENNRLNDVTRDYPFFDYFIGAAVHYEGFFLDFQIDPAWFARGPDFLSGSAGNMFINASLGYRF